MLNKKNIFYLIILFFMVFLLYDSFYVISPNQQGILKFSLKTMNNTKAVIQMPGLHFKWPLIATVKRFDMRLQTETGTKQFVTYYIKWRIVNVPQYYASTLANDGSIKEITAVNLKLSRSLQYSAIEKKFGIKIVDVRIQKNSLSPENTKIVYGRMAAEGKRIAEERRATDKMQVEDIRVTAEKNVTIALATAEREAKRIQAEGDAEAARIYADAYNKDPEFYVFMRSLKAYKKSFANKRDILILKPDTAFFKYFNYVNDMHGKQ